MPHFCQIPWIKAEGFDFAHIFSVSFQIQHGGVQRTNATQRIIVPSVMDVTVWHFCHPLRNLLRFKLFLNGRHHFVHILVFCSATLLVPIRTLCLSSFWMHTSCLLPHTVVSIPLSIVVKASALLDLGFFNSFHFSCCPLTGFNSLPWQPRSPRSEGEQEDVSLVSVEAANWYIICPVKGFKDPDKKELLFHCSQTLARCYCSYFLRNDSVFQSKWQKCI